MSDLRSMIAPYELILSKLKFIAQRPLAGPSSWE